MNYNLIINTVYFVYGKNKYLTNFGQVSRVEKKQLKVIFLSKYLYITLNKIINYTISNILLYIFNILLLLVCR